jgi:type 1 fimbriae regulatory protein FimB
MSTSIPVALSLTELRHLLAKTREHDDRCYVMFLLMTLHGLRVSEAIDLRRQNFTPSGAKWFLTVQRLKGSKKTVQRLIASVDPLLNEAEVIPQYLTNWSGDLLFTNDSGEKFWRTHINKLFSRYAEWADVPSHKRHPHVLKHTCGTLMRRQGIELEKIQAALGHEKLSSTAQYLRVSTDEADEARGQAFNALPRSECHSDSHHSPLAVAL